MRRTPPELAARYEAEGWWTDDTIGDLLARGLAAHPDQVFRVHSAVRPYTGTYAEVELLARRLAGGLRARGVGPGDAVAFQLPNWMEAAATFWAASFLGAAVVPIVHFYGRKELGYILGAVRPKVFVTADRFGRLEHDPQVTAGVPVVGIVRTGTTGSGSAGAAGSGGMGSGASGGAGAAGSGDAGSGDAVSGDAGSSGPGAGVDFGELLADEPLVGVLAAEPGEPALLAFTSGTTRDPKGVVHSHRTLGSETRQLAATYPPDRGPQLTAAPVGHFIGMINAFLIPLLDGQPITLLDVWDPAVVLSLIEREDLNVGGGATYFVTSLLDHPDFREHHLKGLRYAGLGGAPVPPAVTRRLTDLGVVAYRAYGSTEHPSITGSPYHAAESKRLNTDGTPMRGVETRLADDGEILSRGPDLCLGYTDPELTAQAFDDDGWYHTGDIGELDDDGYLTIVDRKADVIIRGGENISALEVEDLLLGLPGVAEAAVVAAPDARLGEHAAAFLRMRPGCAAPELDAVRAHLQAQGLARQKWPEELHPVEDFPRTASGKVQKYQLRRGLRHETAQAIAATRS